MASDYTDTELTAAVDGLLNSDDTPQDSSLGGQDSSVSFSKIQQLLAGVFMTDPAAIFYVVQLAVNKLKVTLDSAIRAAEDISTAATEMANTTTPVTGTSLLTNAAGALADADLVLGSDGVLSSPALTRYSQAVDTFVDKSITPNIRKASGSPSPAVYSLARPPGAAQAAIRTQLPLLVEYHAEIVASVTQLLKIVDDFKTVSIVSLASATAIKRVRKGLVDLKARYDADSPFAAASRARDAYLQLQAGRAALPQPGLSTDPELPRLQATTASSYSMYAHSPANSATAAKVTGTKSGPYNITSSNKTVKVAIDGGSDQTFDLTQAPAASITGTEAETFDIHAAQQANLTTQAGPFTIPVSPNNVMKVYVDGVCYTGVINSGVLTAAQLKTDLSDLKDSGLNLITAVVTVTEVSNTVVMQTAAAKISVGNHAALNSALGFTNEQSSDDSASTKMLDANNQVRFMVDSDQAVEATLPIGTAVLASAVAAVIPSTYLAATAAAGAVTIASKTTGPGSGVSAAPTTAIHRAGLALLGLDQLDSGSSIELTEVVRQISLTLTGAKASSVNQVLEEGLTGVAEKSGSTYRLKLPLGSITLATADDQLEIKTGSNAGKYEISSITTAGSFQHVNVARAFSVVTGDEAAKQQWATLRDQAVIESSTTGLSSKVEIKQGGPLGWGGTVRGTVSGLRVKTTKGVYYNLKKYGILVGDYLKLDGPTYTTEHTVVAVADFQADVTPQVSNDLTGHRFTFTSAGLKAYAPFETSLTTWQTAFLAADWDTLDELDRLYTPLLVHENPTQEAAAEAKATALKNQYTDLRDVLDDLEVPRNKEVDQILDTLLDRGLDRAHAMMLAGEVQEVFALDMDGASYSGAFQAAARAVVQNDMVVSREGEQDAEISTDATETDADEDFSDMDDEMDVMDTDDIPDEEDMD